MTPIKVLSRYANRSRTPYEAESTDGSWLYIHVDDGGSPWHVEYRTTKQWTYYPSLRAARAATADGSALQQMIYDCEAILRDPQSGRDSREQAERRLGVYRQVMARRMEAALP